MFNRILSKAVNCNLPQQYLHYVYFDKEYSSYVASDSHMMLIEKTQDTYPDNTFLSPRTGLVEDVDLTFPEWYRIVPEDEDVKISKTEFQVHAINKKDKNKASKIVQIMENGWLNAQYLLIAIEFVGSDFKLTKDSDPRTPYKFVSKDGLRTALVMGLAFKDKEVETLYSRTYDYINSANIIKSSAAKRTQYVYLAYDKEGKVLGVFKNKIHAMQEGSTIKEFPIL